MNISQHGLDFVSAFEGGQSADGLFHAYWDPWGKVWTVGYGETHGVHSGIVWSRAQAENDLRKRMESSYEPAINALGVPLTQNQYDALCSFVWNLGPGSMQWDVGRHLRARDYQAAADALLEYDRAGGQVLSGLSRRRHAERALFLTPDSHPKPPRPVDPHHYLEYPDETLHGSGHSFNERKLAKQIDGYLQHPHLHHHGLKATLPIAVAARKRIWVVSVFEPPHFKVKRKHPDWGDRRGSRYQWWSDRIRRMEKALG